MISAFGVSYFIYQIILWMPFFPFLNLTGLYIVLGIGADDVFVLIRDQSNKHTITNTNCSLKCISCIGVHPSQRSVQDTFHFIPFTKKQCVSVCLCLCLIFNDLKRGVRSRLFTQNETSQKAWERATNRTHINCSLKCNSCIGVHQRRVESTLVSLEPKEYHKQHGNAPLTNFAYEGYYKHKC